MRHTAALEAVSTVPNLPAGQRAMHAAAPMPLNWPHAQSVQLLEVCAGSARLLPAVQAVHATCAGSACQRPGGQLVQAAEVVYGVEGQFEEETRGELQFEQPCRAPIAL